MSEPTVAVLGASQDRRKFGNKAVRAYLESGMTVLPVNPREATIEGLVAYPNLDSISEPLDYVSVYLPPAVGLQMLPAIAAKKPREVCSTPAPRATTCSTRRRISISAPWSAARSWRWAAVPRNSRTPDIFTKL